MQLTKLMLPQQCNIVACNNPQLAIAPAMPPVAPVVAQEENGEKLEAFHAAVNSNDNSHLVSRVAMFGLGGWA